MSTTISIRETILYNSKSVYTQTTFTEQTNFNDIPKLC